MRALPRQRLDKMAFSWKLRRGRAGHKDGAPTCPLDEWAAKWRERYATKPAAGVMTPNVDQPAITKAPGRLLDDGHFERERVRPHLWCCA